MNIVLAVFVVLCFLSSFPKPNQACLDDTIRKVLEDNLINDDVITLLKGKEFVDIWGEKSFADNWDCALNEYNWDESTNSLKVKLQNTQTFNEVWTGDNRNGILMSTGDTDGHSYTYEVFFFYADENVIGYYTCDSKPLATGTGRLVVAMVLNKMDDEEALRSLKKAEEKINELKKVTGDMIDRVSPKTYINGV